MPEPGKQIHGSGESGAQFVFTDLDELDSIIVDLETMRVEMAPDEAEFDLAITAATPPARDDMSHLQAVAYLKSLKMARSHNASMLVYVIDQLDKLQAARHSYLMADADAEDRLLDAERGRR